MNEKTMPGAKEGRTVGYRKLSRQSAFRIAAYITERVTKLPDGFVEYMSGESDKTVAVWATQLVGFGVESTTIRNLRQETVGHLRAHRPPKPPKIENPTTPASEAEAGIEQLAVRLAELLLERLSEIIDKKISAKFDDYTRPSGQGRLL